MTTLRIRAISGKIRNAQAYISESIIGKIRYKQTDTVEELLKGGSLEKTTAKLRVIFNASAKTTEIPLLDECLYKGLVMLPSLVGIILRAEIKTLRNNGGCKEGIFYKFQKKTEISMFSVNASIQAIDVTAYARKEGIKGIKFRYVKIADSPADLASREEAIKSVEK
ncbi:hypothetical protein DINM_000823 [Dirofilaria immitis]|nr:hypothetical protein [Dirofilaria immitis]